MSERLFNRIRVQVGLADAAPGEPEPWTGPAVEKLKGTEDHPVCLARITFDDGEVVMGVGVIFPEIDAQPDMGMAICMHLRGEKGHSEVVWDSLWDVLREEHVREVKLMPLPEGSPPRPIWTDGETITEYAPGEKVDAPVRTGLWERILRRRGG